MPNRILREGILTSASVSTLGWPEEVFYRRLHSVVDDFGRYFADPGLLRAACYPRQLNKVSDSDIEKWTDVCAKAALVRVYPASDGERYLEVVRFGQQVRAKKSKFPEMPSECVADAAQVPSARAPPEQQAQANAHLDVSVFGDVFEEKKRSARKRTPSFDAQKIELPDWLDRELWCDWCRDRLDRNKRITERGAKEQLAALDEFRRHGSSPERVIRHAIASGNQGLYAPPKLKGDQVAHVTTPSTQEAWKPDPPLTPEQREASLKAKALALSAVKVITPKETT